MKCIICGKNSSISFACMFDDRYGYPNVFSIHQCHDCGHQFLEHDFQPRDLENLYTRYYPRSKNTVDDYVPLIFSNNFITWLNGGRGAYTYVPKNVKVLDIGCGFAGSIGYHLARGCEAHGVEADSNLQKIKDKFGFNIKIGLFNANDYESCYFDFITMDQVLEHTVNPIEILTDISKIIKPNGTLVLAIPNPNGWGAKLFGRKWIHWHTPYHLQHFSKKSLQLLAKESGYTIQKIKTLTSSEWLYYQWLSVITYPKRGEKSIFWDGQSRNIRKFSIKYILIVFFSVTHKLKINHIITRFFDFIGFGDSYMIILKKKI